ncbi:hypothetical protein PILCRDRAFT_2084 [Piloderma croceum F 1598]|uniref:Uncharacterized protein n=1 Tax=Piloderma croceum (strain F 1598) TaxID=765440 RepID=A0A0C3BTB9_PILCF|nr:hypothetical protein PILCRDRAFT_2084 [Piloderma croceum F 1598]
MEIIELEKLPGLKRGEKQKVSEEQESAIRTGLVEWREDELLDKIYPETSSISAQTVLGDDVIDKLASCGERIETQAEMQRHVQWAIGFDANTGYSTIYSEMLLAKLRSIYTQFDDKTAVEDAHIVELQVMPEEVDPTDFYATSAQLHTRQTGVLTAGIEVEAELVGQEVLEERGAAMEVLKGSLQV